ncbi:MAG: DAK2 domain protein [Syntrophorhabdus sp. PtaU1.Bin058]|nr:MAG: DAK2 domain protein [Syntrophorhabdus sp. PtaU1.Bin058]
MAILYCGAKRFKQVILAGADWVVSNRSHLNKINVFPVPDGDTGSNMSMTLIAAVREIEALQEVSLETTVKAAAWGSLMGARGNSGIILAQILAGMAEGVEGRERLFAADIVSAFSCAVRKAYKAILHPAEGTILTVVRETSETAERVVKNEQDLAILLDEMLKAAWSSVERTPLLLPRLKEAGVVDAGGLGFFYFLEGMVRLIRGDMKADGVIDDEDTPNGATVEPVEHHWNYRYCTEFILKGSRIPEDAMKENLGRMGDSIVLVGDTRLARVHIHTGQPDEVLRYASSLGQVSSIKVDDMLVQHTSHFTDPKDIKTTSVVAVVLGDGLKEIFYNAGSELVVDGGPTRNPSTSDIVSAIETVTSPNVIILPNHKNVYPAAIQAAGMTPKEVTVLKTSSAPEGLSALFAYMDDAPFEKNVGTMEGAWKGVKSGEVAQASRDVTAKGIEVKTGDSIGIYGGEIRCSSASVEETVMDLAASMLDPRNEIITLFYGDSIGKQDAETLQSAVQERFKDKTVELYYGGQPYAQYIISIE